MDEWRAERDRRDDAPSSEAQIQAPTGLLRATLICSLVAVGLAIFVAPSVKREARALASQAQSGLDMMATGSIRPADPARRDPIAREELSKAETGSCKTGTAGTSEVSC